MKTKFVVEIEGADEATLKSIIADIVMLIKNSDAPISSADIEKYHEDDNYDPHYMMTPDEIVMDYMMVDALQSSSYVDICDIVELLKSCKINGTELNRHVKYDGSNLRIPNIFNIF